MPEDSSSISHPPLCVDLDHTLLKVDLLYESLFFLLKRNPLAVFALLGWTLRGRAYLKHQIALLVQPEVKNLPYRPDLVEYLRSEKKTGRRLVLVTAADELIGQRVQKHLQLFDEVLGSNGVQNLKGKAKAQMLEQRFGKHGFDYVGDSNADFKVWRSARRALVVSDRPRFARAINAITPVERVFPRSSGRWGALARALRVHQWSKNLLVLVPIITSHKVTDPQVLLSGIIAFFSFSLVCSSVYVLNDILDLEADRAHTKKRFRAFAAGELSVVSGIILSGVLLLAGVSTGLLVTPTFLAFVAIYVAGNFAYSIWLKRVVMLDVVILACFYSLRLLAGGAATGIGCSEWLLAFSVFFFFCLAMVKRYSELRELAALEGGAQVARGYRRADLEPISSFGVSSGMLSVLVLVLYVMSNEVRILYHRPVLLLLLCPLFLYWITRVWFKAHRGEVPQDPVVFALTDRTSYIAGILAALVLFLATLP